ncbi:GNAT family N-acetyltransferase [Streptomyces sp. NBC_01280]|uniref:GNAT family N-acetyltransferase n=1 Tax=Streptomyces sp. NBC_01280 TaxID=2903810 RepID=UPI002E336AB8|nr:GNAT family protein [Streptomyces sp. NBC_01280]
MTREPLAAGFSAKPVLTGDKTVLRPFTAADADTMAEIIDDPEVRHFTGDPSNELTVDFLRSWYGSRGAQDDRLDLAVTDRATGRLVGEVVLYDWDPEHRSCTFRTLVGPEGRGRGLGTEAARLIVGHGFERLGLHRIALDLFSHNHRARRVYEKVGFVEEGVARQSVLRDGQWYDSTLMSVLAPEWAEHQGRPQLP